MPTEILRWRNPSVREQICQYIMAQIDAEGKPDGLLVDKQRSLTLDPSLLPAAVVYLLEETPQKLQSRSIRVRREVVVVVELRVAGEPTDVALDPLINWVVQQVMADFSCGGLAHEIEEIKSDWAQSVKELGIGAVAVRFKVTYYTQVNDLVGPS